MGILLNILLKSSGDDRADNETQPQHDYNYHDVRAAADQRQDASVWRFEE
ncbi:MAG: hypothetical protein IJV40_01565 [Oscillospiraceae bacterium]|nr:hypothetical protein [Oscillospiraceae bacterium]